MHIDITSTRMEDVFQIDGRSSPTFFPVERGVSSRLNPFIKLFNIVVDPLLRNMEAEDLGLCVSNLHDGAYLHADDIRTVATSMSTL